MQYLPDCPWANLLLAVRALILYYDIVLRHLFFTTLAMVSDLNTLLCRITRIGVTLSLVEARMSSLGLPLGV